MYLIINGKRVKKKKTMSAKGSDPKSPIWNEAFTFNLPSTSFPSSGLEVKMSIDSISKFQSCLCFLFFRFMYWHQVAMKQMQLEVVVLDYRNAMLADNIGKT